MVLGSVIAVTLGASSWADGGISLAEFEDVVGFHHAELAPCRARPVQGAAVVQVGVSAEGTFEWNSVLADSKPETAACFSRTLRSWRFPADDHGTRVQYVWKPNSRPLIVEPGVLSWPGKVRQELIGNCYLGHRPSREAAGVIRAELLVGPSGAMLDATLVETSPALSALESCVLRALRITRLPPMPRAQRFSATWSFSENAPPDDAGTSIVITPMQAEEDYRQQVELFEGVREQVGSLAECTNAADGGRSEPVVIELTILPDGSVGDAREETIAPVATCVVRRARRWSFPRMRATEPHVSLWSASVESGRLSFLAADEAGGLAPEVIRGTISRHFPQIYSCYEARLQAHPTLCGELRSSWQIGPQGLPMNVEIELNETGDRELAKCVADQIRSWVFARPFGAETVDVTYPWVFRAEDPDAGASCCPRDGGFRMCTN